MKPIGFIKDFFGIETKEDAKETIYTLLFGLIIMLTFYFFLLAS